MTEIPDYAKNEGGQNNWLKAGKSAERTTFYKAQYEKEKVKLEASQKLGALFENVETEVNLASQKISTGDTLSKFLLRSFKSEGLMWQGLKNLQEQGYQVDWFPAGYTVEVINNRLSIYKETSTGSVYFESPETKALVKDLKLFDIAPPESIPPEEPVPPEPEPVPEPEPIPEEPAEALHFSVDETLPLNEQWNLWKTEIIQMVVTEGMSIDFKKEEESTVKLVVRHGDRKERMVIQRFLSAKKGGYTSKDAKIAYDEHEFPDPIEAVTAVIQALKAPKEKVKITMPWQKHEHDEDEDSHDGYAH